LSAQGRLSAYGGDQPIFEAIAEWLIFDAKTKMKNEKVHFSFTLFSIISKQFFVNNPAFISRV